MARTFKYMEYYHTNERPEIIEMIRAEARKSASPQNLPGSHTTTTITLNSGPAGERDPTISRPVNKHNQPVFQPPRGCLDQGNKMLNIKTGNQWLDEQQAIPAPQKLFGDFWMQGELCLLFADTNMGKSILAVQIGDSISRNVPIGPFPQDAPAAPVLYIDFELSAKQFEMRYRDAGGAHRFSEWFYRAEYNPQKEVPCNYNSFEVYMQDTLDWAIRNTEPNTLIIDNITCLSEGNYQTASRAVNLMKYLKKLQADNNLSILVLAHTPKRPGGKTLGSDDMGGSKMLMNFADSAFAIGQSNAMHGLRYLKQVKQRSGSQQYGSSNICLMKLIRKAGFLHYEFCGYGDEHHHSRRQTQSLADEVIQQVTALHGQGLSQRQIAAQLAISRSSVVRLLGRVKAMEEDGAEEDALQGT